MKLYSIVLIVTSMGGAAVCSANDQAKPASLNWNQLIDTVSYTIAATGGYKCSEIRPAVLSKTLARLDDDRHTSETVDYARGFDSTDGLSTTEIASWFTLQVNGGEYYGDADRVRAYIKAFLNNGSAKACE